MSKAARRLTLRGDVVFGGGFTQRRVERAQISGHQNRGRLIASRHVDALAAPWAGVAESGCLVSGAVSTV